VVFDLGYRRIPFGEVENTHVHISWSQTDEEQKLKSNKYPKSFRSGAEPAEEFETVAEIPIPTDMISKDEETFAVDCEPVLEANSSGQAFGGEAEDDDDDW
jgi:hypothetical protein